MATYETNTGIEIGDQTLYRVEHIRDGRPEVMVFRNSKTPPWKYAITTVSPATGRLVLVATSGPHGREMYNELAYREWDPDLIRAMREGGPAFGYESEVRTVLGEQPSRDEIDRAAVYGAACVLGIASVAGAVSPVHQVVT